MDNTEDGRYVDAMVALTKNTMKGSSVLPSSLLSLLYNFLCTMLSKTSGKDRHVRMIEKWATKDLRTPAPGIMSGVVALISVMDPGPIKG